MGQFVSASGSRQVRGGAVPPASRGRHPRAWPEDPCHDLCRGVQRRKIC